MIALTAGGSIVILVGLCELLGIGRAQRAGRKLRKVES